MKRKLGINSDCLAGLTDELTTLTLARRIGFEAFTTTSYELPQVAALKNRGDALGMDFPFLHAPFMGINAMWLEEDGYRDIYSEIVTAIDSAATCGVPAVIVHLSSTWMPPAVNELGASRFDAIVDYAGEKGVTVALENLRVADNLLQLKERYALRDHVRFCFDCGHQICYTPDTDWLDAFGSKLIATHLHDNPGRSPSDPLANFDNHWLPFDGIYDYENMIRKMDACGYTGPLMLEVFRTRREDYEKMTAEEYLTIAYQRLKKVSEL